MNPEICHFFADGLYAKEAHLPAGMKLEKHQHTFTHFSILAKGCVMVFADGKPEMYFAPACIEIKANVTHEIEAIESSVWYCVHATDEVDASNIDKILITKG
jgi:quercetin dioxygenase-like cupin family protein